MAATTITREREIEAVHLDQQLVQRLLALLVGVTARSAASAPHRVDLVDEDDAAAVLRGPP